jgi:UDP-2-acetamido-3-amino-2,3-dideoxy-glucuronate N-acetyltransferase
MRTNTEHPLAAPAAAIHPAGICEAAEVGVGTRIAAFAHVRPDVRLGRDCLIQDHVFIDDEVTIGDRVTVKPGVTISRGVRIEEDVLIGPAVTFIDEGFPAAVSEASGSRGTVVRRKAALGANCTILPGLTIGTEAVVGAGSVVTQDVPSCAIVIGNPARIVGYVDATDIGQTRVARAELAGDDVRSHALRVGGVSLHRLVRVDDLRGSLVAGESDLHVPFQPRRFFSITRVPSVDVRGAHAHRACKQFLVCVSGSVAVVLDDGRTREEVHLDDPQIGLYVPPMVWSVQYRYTDDAVLLVLASDPYEPQDYIRDYDEFVQQVRVRRSSVSSVGQAADRS